MPETSFSPDCKKKLINAYKLKICLCFKKKNKTKKNMCRMCVIACIKVIV